MTTKIEGYVICQPVNTWGNKDISSWHLHHHTFGETAHQSWIRWLCMTPDSDDWDRKQTAWINRGYCAKKATMEVDDGAY